MKKKNKLEIFSRLWEGFKRQSVKSVFGYKCAFISGIKKHLISLIKDLFSVWNYNALESKFSLYLNIASS